MRLLAAALVAALLLLGTTPARAQSAADQAAAEALFKQARELMTAGRYADACPKLAESQRLDPSAGTLLNLATCYEKNGQIASAWVTYKEAASAAQRANEADRARLARARVTDLEPRLPMLTITVAQGADVPDLVVKRDGQPVGRPVWGTPIPVDPGPHVVEASAPGRKAWKSQSDVAGAGARASVEVPVLEPEAPAPAPAAPAAGTTAPPAPAPEAPASPGSTQRLLAWIAGGVGVASMGTGAAFGVVAKNRLNASSGHCQTPACDPTGLADVSDAKNAATISTITFVAGGVLLAGGIVLYLTAPSAPSKTGLVVAPAASPSFAGLSLRGGW